MAEAATRLRQHESLPKNSRSWWQDRMVLEFLSLRRPTRVAGEPDEVIDLSDPSDAEADLSGLPVAGSEQDQGEPEGHLPPQPDAAAADGAAGSDGTDGELPSADESADPGPAAAPRLSRVTGYLTLSRSAGRTATPTASVVIAWLWLVGLVLAGCVATTIAIGLFSGGAVFDPAVFVSAWRVANLMPVDTAAGPVSLVPMVPAMVVLALVVRASSWLWAALQRDQQNASLPTGGLGALGGAYLIITALIVTSPTSGTRTGPMTQGWAAMLGLVVLGIGWTWARHVVRPRYPRSWLLGRAAGAVLALLLAVSLLLLLVQLLLSWSQFQEMSNALLSSGVEPASRLDAAALGAIQLGYLPNVVVWVAAYLVGAGFAVGTDTIVSPFSVTVGTLPELPLSTLLPSQPLAWPWLPPLLVALGSILAGSLIRNAGLARQLRTRLFVGGVLALFSAMAMSVLAAASAGGLGAGRLAVVGPHPLVTGVATLLVVGFGQAAWAVFPTLVADLGPFAAHAKHRARRVLGHRPSMPKLRLSKPQLRWRRAKGRGAPDATEAGTPGVVPAERADVAGGPGRPSMFR